MDCVEAARRIVEERYPDADAAFLGGSVVRGQGTATSDLDLLIVLDRAEAPFRESFRAHGWPVEAFVHTPTSCRAFFESGRRQRRPVLATICAEGLIVVERNGAGAALRAEAESLLRRGPDPLSPEELRHDRYMVTDLLDDFRGLEDPLELSITAMALAAETAAAWLAVNGDWIGYRKWVARALRAASPERASGMEAAVASWLATGSKAPLIEWAEGILAEIGGPLFEGFHERARREPEARLDHVQITVPIGKEERARDFYCGFLGLPETAKPESLAGRGGLWLLAGDVPVHVGVEDGVDRTATKAHVAYRVRGLDAWRERIAAYGLTILESAPIPGFHRFEFRDPFGNRVELISPME